MNLINKKVCRGISILILLTLYLGLCFEVAALEEMAVGELHALDGGFSIEIVEANDGEGTAWFRLLYQEVEIVDEKGVNRGERFRLNGGGFHFEATLESVFRREDTIMVHLVDYGWELGEEPYVEPVEPTPPAEPPVEPYEPYTILYSILIVSAAVIVLIFVVFKSIGLKDRIRQQKIGEYRAKMEEWEKEGYDVSELKEVLEEKK